MRYWQVTALYVTSSLLGLLYIGLIKGPSRAEPLVLPSVAAAVIGGTSAAAAATPAPAP